jgi:hypothetical protein
MKDCKFAGSRAVLVVLTGVLCCGAVLRAQGPELQSVDAFSSSGQATVGGKTRQYKVEHLPASSFPALPTAVAAELNRRGCLIPQTFEAHGPENVIHGSFRRPGSNDWAVLCSARGTVSFLVFFEGEVANPVVLRTSEENSQLEPNNATGKLEFDWAIDRATPEQLHEAQAGIRPRPAPPDHDAIADSTIDGATMYWLYTGSAWSVTQTTE